MISAASWRTFKSFKLKLLGAVIIFVFTSALLLIQLRREKDILQSGGSLNKVYSHEFSKTGLGNKFSEVLIGLYFARNNGLKYKFDYDSFVLNHRKDDYEWFADLLASRYNAPGVYNKLVQAKDLLGRQSLTTEQVTHGYNGFFSRHFENCGEVSNCFMAEVSFFNAVRELQDLLNIRSRVHRVAIHLRFGDIGSFSSVNHYQQILRNLDRINKEIIPEDRVHFVYYTANDREDILTELKVKFPTAHYHNMRKVEDTIKFLASSQYHITSGSSLSYMAAYLCPDCHIIFTEPKERFISHLTDENLNKTFYYMDEWIPYYKLLDN
ncbi:hypothetical protein K7432_014896 [Basidiobolus ranarum]|uniref:L-Fucosyltransferase n=1 Tax=Basidiobolus ranarum TaxID=34480 RepID=A0ABR2WGY3_9FUNG